MSKADREQMTAAPDGLPDSAQPRWRQDFPIDWPQDHYIARRDFTGFLVLTSLAFAIGQCWIVAQNFFRSRRGALPIKSIARVDEVPIGGVLQFSYPAEHDECALVRLSESSFVAFSRQCTHLSCSVIPEADKQRFYCPCHEGVFDLSSGAPTAGPPRRPLARVNVEFRQGMIYATGVQLRNL